MTCACGATVELTSGSAHCASCGRQHLSCPTCGAHITANPDAVVVACPYCDTALQHVDLSQGTPYFTVHFNEYEMQARLLTFLLNRFGIPGDFQQRFGVVQQQLIYLPVHLYHVTARLSQTVFELDSKAVVATRRPWYRKQLDRYRFAMRAKVYADPRKIRGAVYPTEIGRQDADREAHRFGGELLKRDKKRFDKIATSESIELHYQGMVYYPLYEVTYGYGSQQFRSVFDASNGVVCHTEHPMCLKTRAALKLAGILFLALTLVAVLVFALSTQTPAAKFVDPWGVGGIGGAVLVLLTGLAVSGRILRVALSRQRSGEEIEASEHPLELPELTQTMAVQERKQRA